MKAATASADKRPSTLKQDIWNLPNILTMGRVVLIPFVVLCMMGDTRQSAFFATVLFSVAAATDFFDGYIARKRGLVSVWGQFLDPVADKLIVMATLVTALSLEVTDPQSILFGEPKVPVWLVVLLLGREISITCLRSIAAKEGLTIAVIQTGKWKTAFQLIGLIALLIGYRYHVDYLIWEGIIDYVVVGNVLLFGSLVLSITSAARYLQSFFNAIDSQQDDKPSPTNNTEGAS